MSSFWMAHFMRCFARHDRLLFVRTVRRYHLNCIFKPAVLAQVSCSFTTTIKSSDSPLRAIEIRTPEERQDIETVEIYATMATPSISADIPDVSTNVNSWWFPLLRIAFNPLSMFGRPPRQPTTLQLRLHPTPVEPTRASSRRRQRKRKFDDGETDVKKPASKRSKNTKGSSRVKAPEISVGHKRGTTSRPNLSSHPMMTRSRTRAEQAHSKVSAERKTRDGRGGGIKKEKQKAEVLSTTPRKVSKKNPGGSKALASGGPATKTGSRTASKTSNPKSAAKTISKSCMKSDAIRKAIAERDAMFYKMLQLQKEARHHVTGQGVSLPEKASPKTTKHAHFDIDILEKAYGGTMPMHALYPAVHTLPIRSKSFRNVNQGKIKASRKFSPSRRSNPPSPPKPKPQASNSKHPPALSTAPPSPAIKQERASPPATTTHPPPWPHPARPASPAAKPSRRTTPSRRAARSSAPSPEPSPPLGTTRGGLAARSSRPPAVPKPPPRRRKRAATDGSYRANAADDDAAASAVPERGTRAARGAKAREQGEGAKAW